MKYHHQQQQQQQHQVNMNKMKRLKNRKMVAQMGTMLNKQNEFRVKTRPKRTNRKKRSKKRRSQLGLDQIELANLCTSPLASPADNSQTSVQELVESPGETQAVAVFADQNITENDANHLNRQNESKFESDTPRSTALQTKFKIPKLSMNPAPATGNVQNPTCQDLVIGLSAAERLKMTEIKLYIIPKQIIRIELK